MRTIIFIVVAALSLQCSAKDFSTNSGSAANTLDNAQNIHAIIQFLIARSNDLPNSKIFENDPVLGSREDDFDFRVRAGLGGVEHESLKKDRIGRGWSYFATIKSFPAGQPAQAKEAAQNFAAALKAQLAKDGFSQVTNNPWATIVFYKQLEEHLELRIWVSYSQESDGTFVTFRAAPNYR